MGKGNSSKVGRGVWVALRFAAFYF